MTKNFSTIFKPSVTSQDNDTDCTNKRFKICWVDADTILHSAAISLQQSYINVKHKASSRVKRFENKTEFGVRGNKIIPNKWLDLTNKSMESKGKPPFTIEDFEIEECFEIKPEFKNHDDAIEYGLQSIGFTVGGIKKFADSEDYRLIISAGNGNYRNDYAKTLKYKGNRSDKPILYSELKQAMIEQYKSRIVLADKIEAEDTCGIMAKRQEDKFGEDFDKWEECISFIDKDVKCVYSPYINYRHFEDGFIFPSKMDCIKNLVSQIIAGDESCDNIKGLPNLTEQVTNKFNLRKANGCGKTTAENLIAECKTEKECYERAVFAYQSYYGMDPVKFTSWDGEDLEWTWLDFMRETAILVKMQSFEGELWDVEDKLKELGIEYTEELFKEPVRTFVEGGVAEKITTDIQSDLSDIVGNIKNYSSMKKGDLVEMIKVIKEQLEAVQPKFDGLYEMKQFEKSKEQ